MARLCAFLLFTILIFSVAPIVSASAQSNVVTLVLGGEAYDGPPAFKVTWNGEVIGEGVVDTAIDTVAAGRLVVDGIVRIAPETFHFDVPASKFDAHASLRISMTNDSFDNVHKIGDRNLYVVSANINGHEIRAADFTHLHGDAADNAPLIADMVSLWEDADVAIAEPPVEGWPEQVTAASAPNGTNNAVIPAAPTESVPATEGIGAASAVSNAEVAQQKCKLKFDLTIDGFAPNATHLNAEQSKELETFSQKLQGQNCTVVVTGYSDASGSPEMNRIKAKERAISVLEFIAKQAVHFNRSEIIGFGATRQFGSTAASNRLVLIQVRP